MTDASEVFDPKDFESIRLIVHFQNVTTRMEVKETDKASLVEIGEKMLVLELPAKSCNVKHSVMVQICQVDKNAKPDKKNKRKERELLSVTGKVFDLEEVDEEFSRVTIECLQFDEKSWNELLNMYANRQAQIEKFFAAARGF